MTTGAPTDEELAEALSRSLRVDATIVARGPYEYATSFPLEVVTVDVGGERRTMVLKDLDFDRLLPAARHAKPAFLHHPRRGIEAQRLAARSGRAPVVHAAGETWVLMSKVDGVELWQVGDHAVWWDAARWLARFHRRFARQLPAVEAACPDLLRHDVRWYRRWAERAALSLERSDDPRAGDLLAILSGYEDVVQALSSLPPTFTHGEFFASNVLVTAHTDDARFCAVDWEMAAIGAGALDLAALLVGWDDERRAGFIEAYSDELSSDAGRTADDVDRGLLHLSLQWLGWSDGWEPPEEHRRDWIGEALSAGGRLGR